jgi:hypothetical protein
VLVVAAAAEIRAGGAPGSIPPPAGIPYQGKGFTLILPPTWTTGSLGNMAALYSANQSAEVLVLENPVTHRLSDQETQQAIGFSVPQANSILKQQLAPAYRPFAIGPMTGLAGEAGIGRSSAGFSIAGVSDDRHAVLAVTLIFPAALKPEIRDAANLVASIQATG